MENKRLIYIIISLYVFILSGCRPQTNVLSKSEPTIETTHSDNSQYQQKQDTFLIKNPMKNRYEEVSTIDSVMYTYDLAYQELERMLTGKQPLDFKRAVFITENAYLNHQLNYGSYLQIIKFYTDLSKSHYQSCNLKDYQYPDSLNLKKNFAIYSILKDTLSINGIKVPPMQYDFNNNSGDSMWSTTFVDYLLNTGKGNCHSLPYLYKIIAIEIGAEAYLSLAPNHLYLKHRSRHLGWYNTELTSGQFPTDAWVKASGYVTLDAIRNGIYMDTLGLQESIALCVYDLAMGYSKKTNRSLDGFIIKCCDLTLKHHPQNINAILLKAETLKKNYDFYTQQNDFQNANNCFSMMKELYVLGVRLGYREMPREMYLAWLQSSIEGEEKYNNSSINHTLNQTKK